MVPARDGTALNTPPARLWAPLLMLGASLLFATMGVCVKLASELYPAGEIVFYRDLETGKILETWRNPYTNEDVRVVPIANDPFNFTISQ